MPAGGDPRRPAPDATEARPTFVLERFDWGAPDRLEVAGTFSGVEAASTAEPVLAVQGEDGIRRLPAIRRDGDGDGAPDDGERWIAAFAWLEAPVAFDRARLELGGGLGVALPAPGEPGTGVALPVEPPGATPAPPGEAADVQGAVQRMRLEAQLVEESEQLEEARAAARLAEQALIRAQADLATEREQRAADAERFRDGLAKVRASAEEALGAAADARTEAEQQAGAEIAALREHVASLEPAAAELSAARDELAAAREELDATRGALGEARTGAQELLDRLARLADPPTGGR